MWNCLRGEIKSTSRQLSVRLNSRLETLDDFRQIVLDRAGGYPVRLSDVARVAPGVSDETTIVRSDGADAVGIAVQRQSQANTLEISERVRAEVAKLLPNLPEGMNIQVGSDDAIFIGASIKEVLIALGDIVDAGHLRHPAVFAQFPGDPGSSNHNPRRFDRVFHVDQRIWLFDQHADTSGAIAGDWAGGRRRDCRAGRTFNAGSNLARAQPRPVSMARAK